MKVTFEMRSECVLSLVGMNDALFVYKGGDGKAVSVWRLSPIPEFCFSLPSVIESTKAAVVTLPVRDPIATLRWLGVDEAQALAIGGRHLAFLAAQSLVGEP